MEKVSESGNWNRSHTIDYSPEKALIAEIFNLAFRDLEADNRTNYNSAVVFFKGKNAKFYAELLEIDYQSILKVAMEIVCGKRTLKELVKKCNL